MCWPGHPNQSPQEGTRAFHLVGKVCRSLPGRTSKNANVADRNPCTSLGAPVRQARLNHPASRLGEVPFPGAVEEGVQRGFDDQILGTERPTLRSTARILTQKEQRRTIGLPVKQKRLMPLRQQISVLTAESYSKPFNPRLTHRAAPPLAPLPQMSCGDGGVVDHQTFGRNADPLAAPPAMACPPPRTPPARTAGSP
jgi:hypothetical protein